MGEGNTVTFWLWANETADKTRADGHEDLAAALVRLPKLSVGGEVDRIAAALPGALRTAAEPGAPPWAAEYLRYWLTAARVDDRAEGAVALPEAEERARAAHADGRPCPPGACAARNVALCYANIDGPGHTVERELLLTEALEHVEPGTPAHESLTLAHADTLVDDGRPGEAIALLDVHARRTRERGTDVSRDHAFGRVRALRHLDRHDEALAVLDRLDGAGTAGEPEAARAALRRRAAFERARLLAWLARSGRRPAHEAVAALPSVEEAWAHPRFRPTWAEAVEDLEALRALPNDWHLGAVLTEWTRSLQQVGSFGRCARLALRAARLAVRRGAAWTATGMLERARCAALRIARDDELMADLAEVRAQLRALPAAAPPVPARRLGAWLWTEQGAATSPEHRADLLAAALAEHPGDTVLLDELGRVGRVLGLADSAARVQWRRVRSSPAAPDAVPALLESLLHAEDADGVRELVTLRPEARPPRKHA